jgi:hypothetical protein
LGHVLPDVRGVYDRHAYLDEKRAALERLQGLDLILNPRAANVAEIGKVNSPGTARGLSPLNTV